MALVRCSECNKAKSDKALACPSCGYPTTKADAAKTVQVTFGWLFIFGGVIFMVVGLTYETVGSHTRQYMTGPMQEQMIFIIASCTLFIMGIFLVRKN